MDPKKSILPELDLASLFQKRAEAVEKQKEAAANLQFAKADHFLRFWLGGGAMALAAVWLTQAPSENNQVGMFLLSACIIFWLGMWTAAFFSTGAVRRLQDKADAASKRIKDLDTQIAFCHQVLEEAKKVKIQKYAQSLVADVPVPSGTAKADRLPEPGFAPSAGSAEKVA